MEYNFNFLEKKWQDYWQENNVFKTEDNYNKEKFYILDMFPYPSGSGLHVGHPLGYIASDIIARYKKMQGFNVLHPMGYDSFGLPAEQYAIQTGQHPSLTTEKNKSVYRKQLDKIGFSFDWEREVSTSDPEYYKWTQWIFKQLFNSYYCNIDNKALPISNLTEEFEKNGNFEVQSPCDEDTPKFTSKEWNDFTEDKKQTILLKYRLAYLSETMVNWCEELGTVLANDEVKDGLSERGGHPVKRKMMLQWMLRITSYKDRLLNDLNDLDWTESIKDMQRNWIGKSEGASIFFQLIDSDVKIEVFTTRPDTVFGATFMVLCPEHKEINKIINVKNLSIEQKKQVFDYIEDSSLKSERDRMSNNKDMTGAFTGSYAINPFSGETIPIWISDYVLSDYGTGAIMSVPCGDHRDWQFAKKFNLKLKFIFKDYQYQLYEGDNAILVNSGFLDGKTKKEATREAINFIIENEIGELKTNYKIRDAVFSRQRYWGEPFPIYYKNNIPYLIESDEVVELPSIDKYLPTAEGEPPLARAKKSDWSQFYGERMDYNTMPGWAGSSWYFIRYMDPKNKKEFVSKGKLDYWGQVDVYVGGAEHAVGHLLYSRFWTKFLFDRGFVPFKEPFKKMINQGMILGRSNIVYRIKGENKFLTQEKIAGDFVGDSLRIEVPEVVSMNVDTSIVKNDILDLTLFKKWRKEFKDAEFILNENNEYKCGVEIEKMSKSKFNVENPDDIVEEFGADSLRLYEMFLGPITQSKPWNKNGISGCFNFLQKYWKLLHQKGDFFIEDVKMNKQDLKVLHSTIKKVTEDINSYSFNTAISSLMICLKYMHVNNIVKKDMIQCFNLLLSPFAPHVAEEIHQKLGNNNSVVFENFPSFEEKHLTETTYDYPISFNGKVRFKLNLSLDLSIDQIKEKVLSDERTISKTTDLEIKKIIIIPRKIVNIVL
ncbi:MAG: leucine--tRNA ligase [Flavobacteriales bacterium]|nr:leucine--tRNA ligase [Flavobacteriales bacterium]